VVNGPRGCDTPPSEWAGASAPRTVRAMDRPLDRLVELFEVEHVGDDRYAAEPPGNGFLFGGLTMALALRAAAMSAGPHLEPKSLHAMFVRAGEWGTRLDIDVQRISDTRSFSARHLTVHQDGHNLAMVMASFHVPEEGDDWHDVGPIDDVPPAESLEPVANTFASGANPIEVRPAVQSAFATRETIHPYWARIRQPLPGDPVLRGAAVTFVSDYLVVLTPFAAGSGGGAQQLSRTLDHAIWFHRPVDTDGWLLFACSPSSVAAGRFLSHGTVHQQDGTLVASFTQEGLIRPMREG
jgi:acyl-CoA thioesterase II